MPGAQTALNYRAPSPGRELCSPTSGCPGLALIPSLVALRVGSGINIYQPAPPTGPTQQPLETLGNFRGWYIRTEKLPQNLSWTVKQQCVDLLAEGLWEELLDDEQPDITVMDWFEDSRLDVCVYELHVWLLAADRRTVIAQHHAAPRTSGRGPPSRWVQVSHVFRHYGSGVRFIHFLHKTKNRMEPGGQRRTRVTDSSVSVQLRE
ncbi:F-box only protein 50 [Carlito syrichta]|uniref:F-box only protein 50 n=1 Tax=Carlito syrichta TaxID=1868482 RepID=A0A3Q0DL96_CARSF|nr:F-box only protein 50 [Carlito syrichta]